MDKFSMTPIQKRIEKLVTNGLGYSPSLDSTLRQNEFLGTLGHTPEQLQIHLAFLDIRTAESPFDKLEISSRVFDRLPPLPLINPPYLSPHLDFSSTLSYYEKDLLELKNDFENPLFPLPNPLHRSPSPEFLIEYPLHPIGPPTLDPHLYGQDFPSARASLVLTRYCKGHSPDYLIEDPNPLHLNGPPAPKFNSKIEILPNTNDDFHENEEFRTLPKSGN